MTHSKKSKVRIPVTKGSLCIDQQKKKCYKLKKTARERRSIIRHLIEKQGRTPLQIFRALVARRTLGKNRWSEEQKSTITSDINYIRKKWMKK